MAMLIIVIKRINYIFCLKKAAYIKKAARINKVARIDKAI
jgi:hypothetical protein